MWNVWNSLHVSRYHEVAPVSKWDLSQKTVSLVHVDVELLEEYPCKLNFKPTYFGLYGIDSSMKVFNNQVYMKKTC